MTPDNELTMLCQALVNRRFESVHEAEQALKEFEELTTPARVLAILDQLEKARHG